MTGGSLENIPAKVESPKNTSDVVAEITDIKPAAGISEVPSATIPKENVSTAIPTVETSEVIPLPPSEALSSASSSSEIIQTARQDDTPEVISTASNNISDIGETVTEAKPEIAAAPADLDKILKEIRIWEGKKGNSLQYLLKKWCQNLNAELVWNTEKTYDLSQNVIISGTLESALKVTFSQALESPPKYTISKDGNVKLIIE